MSSYEFDVCLVVESESITLADLAARIGVEPSDGSHNIGDPHILKSRGTWESTVWQCCSECPRVTSIEEQFKALARRFPAEALQTPQVLPLLSLKYISIGVFTDAQTPTVELTSVCFDIAKAYDATIEIKLYPSDMT